MLDYRFIGGDALAQLEPTISALGWRPLDPRRSCAFGAYTPDGQLAGFIALQEFPHTEPMYVDPAFRGMGVAEGLADTMLSFMREVGRGFMVVADTPAAAHLCESRGMKRVESPVYIMPDGSLQ